MVLVCQTAVLLGRGWAEARHPSDQQKRLAVPPRRPSRGGLIGLLMAACIGAAAIAFYLISSPAPESQVPAQPSPSAVQASAAKAAPPQLALPAPPAQTALAGAAPSAAAPSPGQAQLLQSMARDRAAVELEIEQLKASIEQLKASQEQMVRDNAAVAEQLKAGQEQMARLIAKASEQNLRPKTSTPPPRPIATPTRKPVPKLSSPQARPQPLAPMQGGSEQQ